MMVLIFRKLTVLSSKPDLGLYENNCSSDYYLLDYRILDIKHLLGLGRSQTLLFFFGSKETAA
jgi:hypothetical protein